MRILKVDNGIYRGPEPKCESDWKQLVDLEIKHVLDLQTGSNWIWFDGKPLKNQLMADNCNMIGWSHPLGGIIPPSRAELNEAVNIMTKYKSIYVHCKQGVDRTGLVCAAYQVRTGRMTPAEAIAELRRLGGHSRYFYWWADFLSYYK